MRENKKYYPLLVMSHAFIGVGIFFIYVHHVRSVFEARTNFSHLTKLGREALLRNEDALYFSFYKTIREGNDFRDGYRMLLNTTTVEYPLSINVVNKFHVLPELVIGYLYHSLVKLSNILHVPISSCRVTEISVGKEPVLECNGAAEPFGFYLEFVWFLGGLTVFLLYMYGTFLSEKFFGGIYAVVLYVIFHKHASKIYERPLARENFAFPFILWQIFYLTTSIERMSRITSKQIKWNDRFIMIQNLTFLTTISLLCWQFSSIIYAVQIIFMMESLSVSSFSYLFYLDYTISQILSSVLSYYLSYGNRKYLLGWNNGPALSLFILIMSYVFGKRTSREMPFSWKHFTFGFFVAFSAQGGLTDLLVKSGFVNSEDNPYNVYTELILHWGLQRKTNFSTTLLACNPDFGFMDLDDCLKLTNCLLLKPWCLYLLVLFVRYLRNQRAQDPNSKKQEDIERAKKYALEDFLEENHISMQEMSNKETERELATSLVLLEQCNYDYERYKEEKNKQKKSTKDEHEDFMSNVKKLKNQISENEKRKEENSKESVKNNDEFASDDLSDNKTKEKPSKQTLSSATPIKDVKTKKDDKCTNIKNSMKLRHHHVYSMFQFFFFGLIGLTIKKLFFLFYTQGCALALTFTSIICYGKQKNIFWTVTVAIFLILIVDPGIQNIKEEYYPPKGDAQDVEHMLEWINMNTEKNAIFGGPVEIIGTVHLATGRPIVNHPHIDLGQISDRTEAVYSIFSRQQSSEIYNQCTNLKIQYLIISLADCTNTTEFECDILSIWDEMQPVYRKYRPFCIELFDKNIPSFLKVFSSKYYGIVKLFSQSVQLNLKTNKMPEKEM